MQNIMALEQIQQVQAVAHGIAMAINGTDPKVKQATRTLTRQAYPEETLTTPPDE